MILYHGSNIEIGEILLSKGRGLRQRILFECRLYAGGQDVGKCRT